MFKSIKKRGVLYTVGIVVNRVIPEKIFRFRVFRVFELEGHADVARRRGDEALAFRWCENESDMETAKRLTFFRSDDAEAAARYSACLASASDHQEHDQVVGGVWRGRQQFDEDDLGVRILLDEDQAWIFAAYVAKNQRGKGVYRRLLEHAISSDKSLVHFASINPYNKPSIAAHREFVKSTAGTCFAIRVLNVACVITTKNIRADRMFTFQAKTAPVQLSFESKNGTRSPHNEVGTANRRQ